MNLLSARVALVSLLCVSTLLLAIGRAAGQTDPSGPAAATAAAAAPRPAALVPLYLSFAGLQAMDLASTDAAVSAGAAREGNPLLNAMRDSPAAQVAFKAGVTAGVVWATERLRKEHPKTAILMMIGLNSVYAAVVAHNYSLAGAQR